MMDGEAGNRFELRTRRAERLEMSCLRCPSYLPSYLTEQQSTGEHVRRYHWSSVSAMLFAAQSRLALLPNP